MKVCIFGTGAVGGTIGGILANADHEVTFIARGEHLKKLQEWGLQMVTPDGKQTIWGHFTNLLTNIDTPDYLFICVKAFSIPSLEESISRLTGPDTVIIPVINGIPWWHFHGIEGSLKNYVPKCLDPDGNLEKFFPYDNLVGSVVYMAATVPEPGVVKNMKHPPRFMVGEIDNQKTDRLNMLGTLLEDAGFKNPVTPNIREQIWLKLCWNIAFNPLSALTGMNSVELTEDQDTREQAIKLMRELKIVGGAVGIEFNLDVEDRMEVARKSGRHKPSMLQDLENGRPLETEAIVGSIVEIAEKTGVSCPAIKDIYNKLKEITL